MTARIATAALGIPLLLALLVSGGRAWLLFLCLLTILAAREVANFYERIGIVGTQTAITLGGLLLLGAAYTSSGDGPEWLRSTTGLALPAGLSWPLAFAALTLGALTREIFFSDRHPLRRAAASCMGSLYVGLFAFLYLAREAGLPVVLLAVLGTWAADTMAFLVGRRIGRTPLTSISPKKTREGAVAGLFGGMVVGIAIGTAMHWHLLSGVVAGVAVAASAELGDLVESAMKREAGVKDAGHLLPGHGGVLDRFDSLLFASVTAYYLQLLL